MKQYDYILTGAGMSGLSLAYYLTQSKLSHKKILLIDKERKTRNDRTWCFWEEGDGPLEQLVCRRWPIIRFCGTNFEQNLSLGAYAYKMIRGRDFYAHMWKHLAQFPNVEFVQTDILSIAETPESAVVTTPVGTFEASFVFDSTNPLQLNLPNRHNLLQHFKGWFIETPHDVFDPNLPYIMDFRVEQHDDCRFLYVLPFDKRRALVEFTLFTPSLLSPQAYDDTLADYLKRFWQLTDYQIEETEFGVIPMSDEPIEEYPGERIVRIGTAGGYTKPSTGYTFRASQEALQGLVENLVEIGQPFRWRAALQSRFSLYDSIFLNVLQENRHSAKDVFTRIFANNPAQKVFRFLDEKSTILQELSIFIRMPFGPFLRAAGDVIRKRFA